MTLPLGDSGRPGGGGMDLPLSDNERSAGAPSGGPGRRASAGAAVCSGGRPPAVGRPLEITRADASACSVAATGAGDSGACSTGAPDWVSTDALEGADVSTTDAVSTGATGATGATACGADSSTGDSVAAAMTTVFSTGVSATCGSATGRSATAGSTGGASTTGGAAGGASVDTTVGAGTSSTSATPSAGADWSAVWSSFVAAVLSAAAFFAVVGVASASSAGCCFFAAAALAGAFLAGFASSGGSSRVNPSRAARRVTMSAYASASEDDGPLAATPSTLQRSRTSAFVIPSSFASSWILIFFAATLSIQPFTVVFASRMLESMRIRVFVCVDWDADTFSDCLLVVDADLALPRPGERPT